MLAVRRRLSEGERLARSCCVWERVVTLACYQRAHRPIEEKLGREAAPITTSPHDVGTHATELNGRVLVNLVHAFVPLPDAVIGAVAGYLSLWLVYWGFKLLTGKEGMGYGDFKMNAAVGAFLGWKMLPLVILLSSVVGLAFGALQMFAARGKWDAGFRFHFGPYLALAGIIAMFWGESIVRWYLQRL